MGYEHTQRGPWHVLLFLVAAGCLVGGWVLRHEPMGHYICLGVGLVMIMTGLGFMQLTVRDEQDALALRFGPLPLFYTRIPYKNIRQVQPGRTILLDGWGIHYFPGRGTTFNIWGFDCVRVELDKRTIRIGTNDVENLVAFLQSRMPSDERTELAR